MSVLAKDSKGSSPSDVDFVAGPLDFGRLTPVEFEKLVFHMLDELGYVNLTWRKGGPGNSANDGGRDLEGHAPSEDLLGQGSRRCWFEVKHRRRSLETSTVQETANAATSERNLDALYVITNATVSNSCIDWLANFSDDHRLKVQVCQGHDLERLLRRCPRTMLQFYRDMLSFDGQSKAISARFLHQFILPSTSELQLLFSRRNELAAPAVIAATCTAEATHGDTSARRWGMVLSEELLLEALSWMIDNLDKLATAADLIGHSHAPLGSGVTYLVSSLLLRGQFAEVLRLLCSSDSERTEWQIHRTAFLVRALLKETADHCSMDCAKLSTGSDLPSPEPYFVRFCNDNVKLSEEVLIIGDRAAPCPLGLVDAGGFCPLGRGCGRDEIDDAEVPELLEFVKRVIEARTARVVTSINVSRQETGGQADPAATHG